MATVSVAPGVVYEGNLTEVHTGGVEEWLPFEKVKLYTNAFIKQNGKLLLGYKKRGFGKDLYNGFGGKVEPGESSEEAALRELQEEAGIEAPLRRCGMLFFVASNIEYASHIDVFVADEYTGDITESEEMRPQWFSTSSAANGDADIPPIPYGKMWADDIYWMPLLLADEKFAARVDFAVDGSLQKWWVGKDTQVS